MKTSAFFICFCFILITTLDVTSQDAVVSDTTYVLKTHEKEITLLFNSYVIDWEVIGGQLDFPYTGVVNIVGFATSSDTIKFNLEPGQHVNIEFDIAEDKVVSAIAIGGSKPVEYDEEFIKNNQGTYKVFCPDVHELVNIAISLTNQGQMDSNMVNMKSNYYQRVMSHFSPYKNHPLIDSLNSNLTEDEFSSYQYYYNLRMNACMYSFRGSDIVNESPYSRLGFNETNYLSELLPLLIDFSIESNFIKFFHDNEYFYSSLIKSYYELVPLKKMWNWVELKFPERYQAYKIFFSPLVQGAHSTQKLSDNNFNETFMFINAPLFGESYGPKEKEALLSRIVFTEIDHNYVNPMTDKFSAIDSVLKPLNCWNLDQSQWYGDSYATFNEYMTWAIFTLYLYDNFDSDIFQQANRNNTSVMVHGRGFPKFKEFNEFVLEWYKLSPKESMEKLYIDIINWIKQEGCLHHL